MFQPFEGVPDYPKFEQEILKYWDEANIFEKLREKNANGERWDFQDGPITANNPMGVHHAWGRTYKDIFNRYHSMRGHRLRWQNGFDCQGLWVEVEVEKALGFKGKPDILAFGMENFSRACRERVNKFAGVITQQSKRLGMWMDWEKSYYTFDDSNIEHIWLFLKKCHEEGWLAPDYRVMPWCWRCETSLSQHESADSYKEVTHRSVYLKFPINERPGDHFLVWTTTPWTLTANVAVALHPELTYVRVKTGDDVVILSKGTVATALKPGYEILEEIPGSELIGLTYSGPFDDIEFQQQLQQDQPRRSVAWEEVGEGDGTGIVHIAPGCGAEDFELGQRENLGFIAPVTTAAHFKKECGELAGLHALDDVETVFQALEKRGRLYRIQRYKHSYPHCWRCSSELIFFATQEWFIRADAGHRPARARLKHAARQVEWLPEYAGKRMENWLDSMGDWNISRKRFWGLPLPVFRDEETGEWEVVGSRAELRERAVDPAKVDALPELHRPWIDEIEIWNYNRTKKLKRIPEVGDAWLDAGIVPFSTVGYNGATDIRMPELRIPNQDAWEPADFITEMREQIRLWFFSMLFMSVALEDRAPYQKAMVYETMLDQNSEKLSKTKKNGVPFGFAVSLAGADPMRWTFCGNPVTKDIRFGIDPRLWKNIESLRPESEYLKWDPEWEPQYDADKPPVDPIHDSTRRLLTLWNVYSFFVTYANLDKPEFGPAPKPDNLLDRWILARLQTAISEVTAALDQCEPSGVTRGVESFVDELSNWYVRRSRRRFWKSDSDTDKQNAYRTLHHCLLTVSKLIAPVMPFSAELIYRNLSSPLKNAPESVHLCDWPVVDKALRDDHLVNQVESVLLAVSLGHGARKESKVKVRQPLAKVLIQAPDAAGREAVTRWREAILEELNVKDIELLADAGDLVSYSLKANLPKLGKKLGKKVGALRQVLEGASPEEAKRIGQAARHGESVTVEVEGEPLTLEADEILVSVQQQSGYSFASEGGWAVALDTTLTPDLEDEGLARDFVRGIQQARKDAGFEVSDRIAILLVTPSEDSRFPQVLEKFGDYVQSETLAEELRFVDADYPELTEAPMGEEKIQFRVERVEVE
jgi:isoleucyl-tRNA synthetase